MVIIVKSNSQPAANQPYRQENPESQHVSHISLAHHITRESFTYTEKLKTTSNANDDINGKFQPINCLVSDRRGIFFWNIEFQEVVRLRDMVYVHNIFLYNSDL